MATTSGDAQPRAASPEGIDARLVDALLVTYTPEGVVTWLRQWLYNPDRRARMAHGVLAETPDAGRAATYEDEAPYETLQEVARLVDSCIPDRRDSYGFRHAMKAAVAMAERGLLATARPDTTATEVAALDAATEAVEADCRICQGTGMATLNPDEEPGSHVCEPPRVQQP